MTPPKYAHLFGSPDMMKQWVILALSAIFAVTGIVAYFARPDDSAAKAELASLLAEIRTTKQKVSETENALAEFQRNRKYAKRDLTDFQKHYEVTSTKIAELAYKEGTLKSDGKLFETIHNEHGIEALKVAFEKCSNRSEYIERGVTAENVIEFIRKESAKLRTDLDPLKLELENTKARFREQQAEDLNAESLSRAVLNAQAQLYVNLVKLENFQAK
jgi:chromosome segregation ATPase